MKILKHWGFWLFCSFLFMEGVFIFPYPYDLICLICQIICVTIQVTIQVKNIMKIRRKTREIKEKLLNSLNFLGEKR